MSTAITEVLFFIRPQSIPCICYQRNCKKVRLIHSSYLAYIYLLNRCRADENCTIEASKWLRPHCWYDDVTNHVPLSRVDRKNPNHIEKKKQQQKTNKQNTPMFDPSWKWSSVVMLSYQRQNKCAQKYCFFCSSPEQWAFVILWCPLSVCQQFALNNASS